jgi:hypothetical protein
MNTQSILVAVSQDTLKILSIVVALMVAVEFVEIRFGERLSRRLGAPGLTQCTFASGLGIVPGCVTAFLVVSLYKAGLVGFGALAAVMLATAGDEAFVMLAVIPRTCFLIFAVCFLVGIIGGMLADVLVRRFRIRLCESCGAEIHADEETRLTWPHFLKDHIYGHVIRKHLLRLFLWLFFTLLVLRIAEQHLDLKAVLPDNRLLLVTLAALVGLVPESGPHVVFVLLFAEGLIPFSVLVASSVAQDGHGVLPLLAYAPKDVAYVKVYTSAVGLAVGLALLALGL